ncbi:TIGR00153 family protein [Teredinibacter franksiae]|uniref:TIGR00153 family protein n=1 Tax=Teredinibacter franksiae TaxID=2761453 RepID=UPI00162631CA|nr:TIGR00153 family protein [Teredinibacter franksiae]
MKIKNPLTEMFGRSPIKPMEEHIAVAELAANELIAFYDASVIEDWAKAEACYNRISEMEERGDEMKKQIRLHLPKSLFLPVPRSDLLDLLTKQDKLTHRCKDIAGLMLGRKMVFPSSLRETVREYLQSTVATVAQARSAINELDELLETGFGGREMEVVENMVGELDVLEQRTDQQQIVIRAGLFRIESELPPVDVIFFYRIIEGIGNLADRAQKTGERLLQLLAR